MVIVCRHVQTEWNQESRLQGNLDSPLTQLGKEQAIMVGELLKEVHDGAHVIHSSPQGRAIDTSRIFADQLGFSSSKVLPNDLLREMSFGTHEGLQESERQSGNLLQELQARNADPYNVALPEGENYKQVQARAQEFLDSGALSRGEIVVAHEALNRMLLGIIGGLTAADTLSLSQPNDVIYASKNWRLHHMRAGVDTKWIPGTLTKD